MNSRALDDLDLEWYRSLVGNMPNGVLVLFDDALRYRVAGPDVLPFSQRRAEDMVDKNLDELFDEATADRLRPELSATIEGEERSFDRGEYWRPVPENRHGPFCTLFAKTLLCETSGSTSPRSRNTVSSSA